MAPNLGQRTLELVDIPSVSREEAELRDHVSEVVPLPSAYATDEALLFATERTDRPLVLLAGHLDTVPPQDNLPGRIEDGWVVGLGASDMKGGLAVMVELARWAAEGRRRSRCDLAFLFFVREELPAEESALPRVFAEAPLVLDADLVVDARADRQRDPRRLPRQPQRHSRLPGRERALGTALAGRERDRSRGRGLQPVVEAAPLEVEVGGLTFVEVLSATRIAGGIADNVIPDRVEVRLNYRYAPNRTREEAEARLRELVGADVEITSNSPPAHVAVDSPLVQRLRETGGLAVEPKQAWTPVAEFAGQGLDAVNLGPGRDALRAPARRARRDRRAGADLRWLCSASSAASVRACRSPPFSRRRARIRSCASSARSARQPRPGSRSSTSARATRASRPTRPSGRRSSTRSRSAWATPRPRACPSCARRSRAGAAAGSASTSTPPPR